MEKNAIAVHELKPIMQIGKNGLSESVLKEIEKHLKKRKVIKVKCLKYFLDSYGNEFDSNKDKIKAICQLFEKTMRCTTKSVGFTIVLTKI